MQPTTTTPAVLCAAGHDPSGGAGIVADGEAIRAAGAHPLSVITCLTAQDTCGLRRLWPQPPDQVEAQCRPLLEDARVSAIKVGLLGSAALARVLTGLVQEHPDLPLVVDPVLVSGAGQSVADAALCNELRQHLFPAATLVTPNLPEAQSLTGASAPDDCALRLLRLGARWVLVTGTHAPGDAVTNRLYGRDGSRLTWDWPRLPGEYHGSGCTLASAIAGRLALGLDLVTAVADAQAYTWQTLARARRTGRCQLTPNRLFALDGDTEILHAMNRLRGLYAITPEDAGPELTRRVELAIAGGARVIQYRDKSRDLARRRAQAQALSDLCRATGARLIINDDPDLAVAVGADGVHLGRDDGDPAQARHLLGPQAIIGVSCYDCLELGLAAQAAGADYVAFGSFFPSATKPDAVRAEPDLLRRAHAASAPAAGCHRGHHSSEWRRPDRRRGRPAGRGQRRLCRTGPQGGGRGLRPALCPPNRSINPDGSAP